MAIDPFTVPNATKYRNRNCKRVKAVHRYLIEGESVSVAEMAARVGVSESLMDARFRRLKKKDGPITWAGLSS